MPDLGKLFGSVETKIEDALSELNKPVSAGAYPVKPLNVDTGAKSVTVFGAPLKLQAKATAQAEILAPDATIEIFDGKEFPPPAGTSYARLSVEASASASGSGGATVSKINISATGSTSANLTYLHARPVSGTRLQALEELVKTSRLPQMANVKDVEPLEVLSFDGHLNVDLGVQAKFGGNVDLAEVINLGAGLSLPMKAHAEYTIAASLGFSLYDEMIVKVAGIGRRDPSWVRARMERKHRDEITFGVAITLDVDYNLKTGADLLLNQIFARIPFPVLSSSASEVLDLFAAGNWDAVKAQISKRAADIVVKLVNDTGWKNWLADSAEVQQLLRVSNFIVNEYSKLDGKVRSLWTKLLSQLDSVGLAKVRALLQKIAAIDLSTIDAKKLVSPELADVLQLIETLSGRDLEELIVSDSIRDGVEKAKALATRIEGLITGLGDKAVEWLHGFEDRTGLNAVAEWLKANGTSVDALQKAGDTWIGSTIQRLVGKELSQIDANDLTKLQTFAIKAKQLLATKDTILAKLKEATKKLQGHFGVKLTLELSRVTEWSSLVDVEVDPKNDSAANALTRFLSSGDIAKMITDLNALTPDDPADADEAPFAIHEIVLTSRHIRTSTFSLFLSFLGLTTTKDMRMDESIVRISAGAGETKQREGIYSGGASIRQQQPTLVSEGAAWVRIHAKSDDTTLSAPFSDVKPSIRLTFVREDTSTVPDELTWMRDLLFEIGFTDFNAPPPNQQTRFSLELDLPADALEAYVAGDEKTWNDDMIHVARRWFSDNQSDVPEYAPIVKNEDFQKLWVKFPADEFVTPGRNGDFGERIFADGPAIRPTAGFQGMFTFIRLRKRHRFDGVKSFNVNLAKSPAAPDDLVQAMKNGTVLFDTHGTDSDKLPFLNFWLVLARVTRQNANALNSARGIATLRFRPNDTADWSEPASFVLPDGGLKPFVAP